jgi:hypothetical protein
MRRRFSSIVPLALVLAAGLPVRHGQAAPANAIPLPVVNGTERTEGTLERLSQVRWYKVALTRGHDYAISGYVYDSNGAGPTIGVYAPSGKRVVTLGLGGDYPAGYELRALESGTYYLKIYSTANPSPTFPLSYGIGVAFDCRTGPTTKCTLAVGQKVRGYYNWTFDEDWRRITAEPGKRYTVLLGSPLGAGAQVLDKRGKVLGSCGNSEFPLSPCASFTASYDGPYYVRVKWVDDENGEYQLGLTSP